MFPYATGEFDDAENHDHPFEYTLSEKQVSKLSRCCSSPCFSLLNFSDLKESHSCLTKFGRRNFVWSCDTGTGCTVKVEKILWKCVSLQRIHCDFFFSNDSAIVNEVVLELICS
jgi:hypothetical protein